MSCIGVPPNGVAMMLLTNEYLFIYIYIYIYVKLEMCMNIYTTITTITMITHEHTKRDAESKR
jgi:hypothetical protein